jgi:hypothetical protein
VTWLRARLANRLAVASACTIPVLAGCGGDETGPDPLPTVECTAVSTQSLSVGQYRIIDPNQSGSCVRVPAAGGAGAEHLYVALATEGEETRNGVEAPYALKGPDGMVARGGALRNGRLAQAQVGPTAHERFHHTLRARERALSESPAAALARERAGRPSMAVAAATAPTEGDQRTFWVCTTTDCDDFVQTTATARHVAEKVAIYVDNNAPAGGYTDDDLARVGSLFDNYLYPIDTTAFGRESDIDNNGVVIVLLTQRVNELSPNCDTDGSVILGYFYGLDLQPSLDEEHSNRGEIFFGLVPDPLNLDCNISKAEANWPNIRK